MSHRPVNDAKILAHSALRCCRELVRVIERAEYGVPSLSRRNPKKSMALTRAINQSRKKLKAIEVCLEQLQSTLVARAETGLSLRELETESPERAQEYEREFQTLFRWWDDHYLFYNARKLGVPVPEELLPFDTTIPWEERPRESESAPKLEIEVINGTEAQKLAARDLSHVLDGPAADMCLDISCAGAHLRADHLRASNELITNWLINASELLNEMQATPTSTQRPDKWDHATADVKRKNNLFRELRDGVRAAQRSQLEIENGVPNRE